MFSILLVPKTVLRSAIRAFPCNSVTGHSPDVIVHTVLTDSKTASALPAEGGFFSAAVTLALFGPDAFFPVCRDFFMDAHGSFKGRFGIRWECGQPPHHGQSVRSCPTGGSQVFHQMHRVGNRGHYLVKDSAAQLLRLSPGLGNPGENSIKREKVFEGKGSFSVGRFLS